MNSPLPLVERKRRQARQRIVDAAQELFQQHGFDRVSVVDIAERAEVGRTTFFRYFGDKQEVVFAREQELLDVIAEAGQDDDVPAARTAAEAVEQLRPLVLGLCDQMTADPSAYVRHYELIDQYQELRARDAAKMQQLAGKLAEVLIRRGTDEATAVLAGQIAVACCQTARCLGNDPHTLVEQTRAAFSQALRLGEKSTRRPRPAR